MSINPNSSTHIVILTVKVFPFWHFYEVQVRYQL